MRAVRRGWSEELRHFASRGVMNIEGLGDAMVAQLLGHGLAEVEAAEEDGNTGGLSTSLCSG